MDHVAKASTTIHAPAKVVWDALVTPSTIKKYMFGTDVASDWNVGSPITWKGEWQGRPYEDKGVIRAVDPHRRLQYTHASSATPDEVHTITIELAERGAETEVTLTQDNNKNEEARQHSQQNWQMMLGELKKLLET